MQKPTIVATVICALLFYALSLPAQAPLAQTNGKQGDGKGKKDDSSKGPGAPQQGPPPPATSITTGFGQYFCLYHDRLYSAGAVICIGPDHGSKCMAGANKTMAAQWGEVTKLDGCKDALAPLPE
jgi:hypothetical protein